MTFLNEYLSSALWVVPSFSTIPSTTHQPPRTLNLKEHFTVKKALNTKFTLALKNASRGRSSNERKVHVDKNVFPSNRKYEPTFFFALSESKFLFL